MSTRNKGLVTSWMSPSISSILPLKARVTLLLPPAVKEKSLSPLPMPSLNRADISTITAVASTLTGSTSVRSMTWKGMVTCLTSSPFWYTLARRDSAVSGSSQPESVMVALVSTVVLVRMGMEAKGKVSSFTTWPSGA